MGRPAESMDVPELQPPSAEWLEKVVRVGQKFGTEFVSS